MAVSSPIGAAPPPDNAEASAVQQSGQIIETVAAQEKHPVISHDATLKENVDGEKKETKEKPQASMGNYFRVFTYGTKLDALLVALSCLTSIGSGIALPLMNIVLGQLVGDFTDYFKEGTTVTKDQFQAAANKNALYIVYLFIGKFVLSYVSMLAIRISGLRMSAALRLAYLRAMFAQPVATIDTISPGKVSTRITTSSNTVQVAISQHFAMLFQSATFIIALYVVAFVKAWLLTFVASVSIPIMLLSYGVIVPPFMKIHKITEAYHDDASALAFEIFSSIRIVVAFGAEAKLARQHEAFLKKAEKNERRAAPLMGLLMTPSMMAMYGTYGLTFWFGIRQISRGHMNSVGDVVVVLFSVMMAVMNMGRLISPIVAIAKASSAATELFVTIDAEKPDTSGLKEPDITANADIHLQDVSFSYPSRPNTLILDGLDIRFEVGKVTAIVGPSGCGKSTVIALIQRWYELLGTVANPTDTAKKDSSTSTEKETTEKETSKSKKWTKSKRKDKGKDTKRKTSTDPKDAEEEDLGPNTCTGVVKVGDVDLRSADLKWWRAHIGLVQQEPFLFNDTIFNNVAFGLCGTPLDGASDEEKKTMVEEACKEAYAEEFISRLPQGYETMVGESGIKLSGGQRQRIAIARSIIKKPPILILDEATSAIDVRTERIVQQALDRVSKNRTTIVIAHRLSTIKRADKIIVLRRGKLVEEGTHEELLSLEDGVYRGLVHAQELALEAEEELLEESVEEATDLQKVKTAGTERSTTARDEDTRQPETDVEPKSRGLFRSVGRLVFEQRGRWALYTFASLGILGAGAVYPIQAWAFAKVIEVFTFTGARFVSEGNFWSGMFGVLAGAVGMSYFVLAFCTHLIAIGITCYYRQEYLSNTIRKRIPFFDAEGNAVGSLTSRLSSDTEKLQQLLATEMAFGLIAVVNLVGSVIIAFVYGWKLSLVGLFSMLPPILAAGYYRNRIEMQFEEMTARVFKDSSQFATEAVGAFRTVASLIMEDTVTNRYQTLLRSHVAETFHSAKYNTLVYATSDSIELACLALCFWYGSTLLASREYDLVNFFVMEMAIVQGAIAAGLWFSFAPNMAAATGAANRIIGVRPHGENKHAEPVPILDAEGGVGIEFENVHFAYKSRDVPVLSKLNLKILPGQFAALVGASGCGKSTTISLLERFYDATSGRILYNGQDITTLDAAEYRKRLSLVSQEPTLYEGTIRENVALSVESATDEEIHQACIDAQIHDFVSSLPDGYNTRLGPKGMSLSGGQKQRLSLARALLRKPKLLLLDEATSSLDSESEKLVQGAIERAASEGGRTVIAVAHRLATIQKADVIFVMGSGRVLEQGDHNTLLRKKGIYHQMCQAQALDR